MRLTRKKVIIVAVVAAVLGLLFYLTRPSTIVSILRAIDKSKAGLSEKTIEVDKHVISYLEGGTGDTVVLLHGFGGDKFNWSYFAKYFKGKYHMIIIDLPGFGDSSKFMEEKYDIFTQVERLKKFIDLKGIKKFHVAGNSMGGYISGTYEIKYPEQILSLCLIDAGGVVAPQESDFAKELKKGNNPFIVKEVQDLDRMWSFLFVTPPAIPDLFKKYVTEKAIKSATMNSKIFKEIEDTTQLNDKLDQIKARTLIIWGDSDRIFHVSCAEAFKKGIADSKLAIIKDCGHLPMLEKPQETAQIYLDFLK